MEKIKKHSIALTVILAIVLIFILEIIALLKGMNGECMRLAVGSICALGGIGGGWGLKSVLERVLK